VENIVLLNKLLGNDARIEW